jgi:3-hydroxyisobutyrate dehydrogenase-like beta-hydroxyacid dehydrogenase
LAELLAALDTLGVPISAGAEPIGSLPVCSPAAKMAAQSMAAEPFAPLFPADLVEKDLGYALACLSVDTSTKVIA